MTKEQLRRLDELVEQYRRCFILHGPLHAGYNELRIEKFIAEKKPQGWEFLRLTADITYVFWNPPEQRHKKHTMAYDD